MQTILIIEDDRAIREAVVDILELEGYRVLSADDGMAGIDLARVERPNLILCDIMMPHLDGYGVLEQLRKHSETAIIPFIFLTARTTAHDIRQGMNLGADDYLPKPFRAEELVRTVQARIERQARLAEKLQARVDELHNNLMSVLPHELNTPLHGILAGVEFLRDEFSSLQPSDIEELLWIIHQSALRMRRFVANSLLHVELASMGENTQAMADDAIGIASKAIVEQVATQEAAAAAREGDLQVRLDDATICISPAHLSKIVEEVLNNAFKFSTPGTLVELCSHVKGDNYVLCVRDSGRGMRDEEIAAISAFRQFQRKHYEQQGMGLGLAIAQRLAGLYRGRMWIESVPGEHTNVQITLPLALSARSPG